MPESISSLGGRDSRGFAVHVDLRAGGLGTDRDHAELALELDLELLLLAFALDGKAFLVVEVRGARNVSVSVRPPATSTVPGHAADAAPSAEISAATPPVSTSSLPGSLTSGSAHAPGRRRDQDVHLARHVALRSARSVCSPGNTNTLDADCHEKLPTERTSASPA
jgi:hypothetical protein